MHEVFERVLARVENGERIGYDLARSLLREGGLDQLGDLADTARFRRVGDKVFFISNHHVYFTNVCIWECRFCAFSRRISDADAYTKSIDDVISEIRGVAPDISEVRITGGIHPHLDLNYYEDLISAIKRNFPHLHIEAFAPTEIAFMARKAGLSEKEILFRLHAAGLGSLTSGGAEIFNSRLRKALCPNKPSVRDWLRITRSAHELGIPSNASILFGHLETYDDWVRHLCILRRLQDKTGGFHSFIPLVFLPKNTKLHSHPQLAFSEVLKMIAISRIVLDNFKQIKFLWLYYGRERIKTALRFGSNDLAGTAYERHKGVARSAGSGSPSFLTKQELVDIIKRCRRQPVERGKLYEEKCVYN